MGKIKIGGIIQNPRLSALSILGVADRPGIAAEVLNALGERHISIQFIAQLIDSQRQDHLCLCISREELRAGLPLAQAAAQRVGASAVEYIEQASLISIFGPDFRERPGIAGAMFSALAARNINILAISTSISTVSCVIEARHTTSAVEALHQTFDLP
jgi:aspartokinase